MSTLAAIAEPKLYYPDSDGKPMAENTIQFRWITTIQGNLDILFHERTDVFVAGDNLWYPVEGEPAVCVAPDVYVAFGRPKGDRGSYKQWEEDGIPLSVVFEVLSPGNRFGEMLDKFEFYQEHGVREYYIIDPRDPERTTLEVFEREDARLKSRNVVPEWVSPLMGVRFSTTPTTVELFHPEGNPFLSFVELGDLQKRTEESLQAERQRADAERHRADAELQRADIERHRANAEEQRADAERHRADAELQRADTERQRADAEEQRAARLAARLRELGVDPDKV